MKSPSRLLAGALLVVSTAAADRPSAGRAAPPEVRRAAGKITEELLRAHTKILASDLLEGRGPATRGDSLAEAYIQSQMEALGVEPGAPGGGWIQKVPLVGVKASFSGPAVFRSERGSAEGVPGDNFVAFSGVQKPAAKIEDAEIVFVGYGIVAPEFRWDDYKDADLSGKVLLMMNNDPESDPSIFAGKTRLWYGRWDYKYLMAAKKGAAGAILIHDPLGRLSLARRPELLGGREFRAARRRLATGADQDVGDRGVGADGGEARRQGPRFAAGLGGVAFLPTGAARGPILLRDGQRDRPEGIGQRRREDPGRGPETLGRSGRLHGAPRSFWDQGQARSRFGGFHLQRRGGQRVRSGFHPLRGAGLRGTGHAPSPYGLLRVRGRGGTGPPGFPILRRAPAGAGREDRRQYQHRFGQLVRKDERRLSHRPGQVLARRRRDRGREDTGTHGQAGRVSGPGAVLPL